MAPSIPNSDDPIATSLSSISLTPSAPAKPLSAPMHHQLAAAAAAGTGAAAAHPNSPAAHPLRLCVTAATHYGQQVRVAIAPHPDAPLSSVKTLPLSYEPPGVWTLTLPSPPPTLYYKYLIVSDADSSSSAPTPAFNTADNFNTTNDSNTTTTTTTITAAAATAATANNNNNTAASAPQPQSAPGDDRRVWEAGPLRVLSRTALPAPASHALARDVWRPRPDPARDVFSMAAFTRVLFRYASRVGPHVLAARHAAAVSAALTMAPRAYVAVFRVFVERVLPGDEVCLVGDIPELGSGRADQATVLADTHAPTWEVAIALPPHVRFFSYRFFIRRPKHKAAAPQATNGHKKKKDDAAENAESAANQNGTTDDGSNTKTTAPAVAAEKSAYDPDAKPQGEMDIVAEDQILREFTLNETDDRFLEAPPGSAPVVYAPAERAFAFPKKWRGSGLALPVFSIRSQAGCGVGEFNDLISVVDLCVKMRYHLLQLLPINDTLVYNDFRDSYPYSAVSSFALHPQYLNIASLGDMPADLRRDYDTERTRLNASPTIDITEVMRVKNRFIREMFKLHRDEFLLSKEFTAWFADNQPWLVPYALFRFFMTVNGSPEYDKWGARSVFSMRDMVEFADPGSFHFDHLAVVYYTQFHLHKQLSAAASYAEQNGVVFKGDLPIGVNRYCVDTWVNPHLFRLDMQAGAPPDFFSAHGQNWLFPTYNWDEMKKDNYGWWRARLGQMGKYFHAYRIDHILGFFRIWEIPASFMTGMSGRFYPAVPITRHELESQGLWDIDRYVLPYVTDGVLQGIFHGEWAGIKDRFFEPLYDSRLKFKSMYDTERKVDHQLMKGPFVSDDERRRNKDMRDKLFLLFNNVCLLRDVANGDTFHPRFMMETTSSFAELPSDEWRATLYNLQNDYMNVRQDKLWRYNGLERLPMMKAASDMLVCGEDLGLVPDCVPSVMTDTSILSLAVQRMPPGDEEFGDPRKYAYDCVATTSSHDTSTFRGWWEEIPADMRMRYWTRLMHRDDHTPPPSQCTPEIAEWAVVDHLRSPAMWAIFPLQDLLAMSGRLRRADARDERINDPSNPLHVWNFRLHLDMETLLKEDDFITKIADLNRIHGRGEAY